MSTLKSQKPEKKQKKFSTEFSTDWNVSIELSTELFTGEQVFHRQPEVIHSWTEFSTGYPQVFNNLSTYPQSFPQYPNSPPWSYPQWLWITYQKTVLFKKAKKKRAKFSAYGVVPTAQCHRFSTAPIETLQKMKRFKKFSTKVFHRWITS